MLKKDKMVICGASGCTNRADKNSNIITLVTLIIVVLTIWRHNQNSGIFNACGIFKTLPNISVIQAFSRIFKDIQGY